jgi:hypothetical protein
MMDWLAQREPFRLLSMAAGVVDRLATGGFDNPRVSKVQNAPNFAPFISIILVAIFPFYPRQISGS